MPICPRCKKEFKNMRELVQHLREHRQKEIEAMRGRYIVSRK